eukprot:gnl/MRDRNA2_/MRDRNA2_86422_c0_seq2.p1 gnl/MRDRNA2_/MRDRNA2_86422_c0~~gnl/MRDRNA2_/MRDRNA2_86422_c0_seq2.p1  ORF type:complete len:1119 (-),score=278.53 gnl/MRDRNA2_/MRDRNA2_86422_c0_seq2:80-3436(-)
MSTPQDIKLEGRELIEGDEARSSNRLSVKTILLTVAAAVLGLLVISGVAVYTTRAIAVRPAGIVEQSKITNKAALDTREYEYAKFKNGLEVVAVQDAKTVSSGFSVAVESGSLLDPKALPGLAHFCEHMLFLGTAKYPDATGFDNYLQMHGGYNNAYTAEEATVYYAQLDKEGFDGGLDRFADFFRAPLFDKQYVQKEVHAIDSEHAKNKQSPQWRINRIINSLADPASAVNTFSTGNLETLYTKPQSEGYDTVEELKKYYGANYCPPRMKLVTFGSDSTSAQIQTAYDKFSDIVSTEGCSPTAPSFAEPVPYPPSTLHKFVHIKGVTPQGQLWVMFTMPDLGPKYKSHPASYLEYVLGYGGEHSLEYVLKEELGLANGVGADADSSSAGTKFWVIFELTPKGRKNIKNVLSTFFYYTHLMQHNSVDMKLYKSLAALRELKWNWAEAAEITDTVMGTAETLTRMGKDDLLVGDSLIQEFDPGYIEALLDMIKPDNMIAAYVDPDFDHAKFDKKVPVRTDPYYEAQFKVMPLSQAFNGDIASKWAQWQEELPSSVKESYLAETGLKEMPEFVHPTEIKDVPTEINLDFAKAPKGNDEITSIYGEKPELISTTGSEKQVYYRQGSTAESPKVNLKFVLRTKAPALTEETPIKEGLLFSIYQSMLQEEMGPKTVDLKKTGVSYSADAGPHTMSFGFGGFKNNLGKMIDMVMDGVGTGVTKNQERFDRIMRNIKDSLTDYSGMPISYAMKDQGLLIQKGGHSNQEILAALEDITVDDVLPVVNDLKKKDFQLTTLVMGNIAKDEVTKLQADFEKNVPVSMNVPMEDVQTVDPVINPGRRVEVRKTNPRKGDPNHVTTVSIQYGVPDIADSVKFGILSQVLRPAAYDELRTNQQLGYVVQGGIGMSSNVLTASVMVQGDAKLPDEIEPQIEMVLTTIMEKKLADMSDHEFEAFKASYAKQILEPPLGFSEEIGHFWPVVARGNTCPDKAMQLLKYLREGLTSKDQLIEAWHKITMSDKPLSKVVVKYFSDTLGAPPAAPTIDEYVKDLRALNVPEYAIELAQKEAKTAIVFSKVDSTSRAELLKYDKASFYPQEIKCGVSKTTALKTAFRRKNQQQETLVAEE